MVSNMRPPNFDGQALGAFGDAYGPITSLFSLLSFLAVVFALLIQIVENNRIKSKEHEEKVEADQRRAEEEKRAIELAKIQRDIAEASARTAKLSAIQARIDAYDVQLNMMSARLGGRHIPFGNETVPEHAGPEEALFHRLASERRNLYLHLDETLKELGVDKLNPPA
jgi:hypothetical protein